MTIEEKAKAYDEAIEKAQLTIDTMDYEKKQRLIALRNRMKEYGYTDGVEELESIFPQLAESEDEKIREWCISHFKECFRASKDNLEYRQYLNDKIIPWLEKQKENLQNKSAIELWKDMRLEVYQQASGNRHEPNYSDDTTKMFSLTDIDEIFEKIAEKHGEQKPFPKFRIGDRMRTKREASEGITDGMPVIISIDDEYYYCTNEKIPIVKQDEYEYPTVNVEQKPADEQFPPLEGLDAIKAQYYDSGFKNGFDEGVDSVKPAEWSEEDDNAFNYLHELISFGYTKKLFDARTAAEMWECLDKRLRSLHPQPKQEWSEEDKDFLLSTKCIIDEVWHSENTFGYSKEELKEMWNWLDTLWQRVKYLQPKLEWSEADKAVMLNTIIADVNRTLHSCGIGTVEHHIRSEAIKFLKSLRSSWKPTEEQMKALHRAVKKLVNSDVEDSVRLFIMYDNLKKLM